MNPDFELLEHLFSAALELEGQERSQFLDASCPASLRAEIDSLLAAHEDATPSFADKSQNIGSVLSVFLGERLSGESIASFQLQEMIGRGGMGVVYRAIHKNSGQTVAVKLIPAHDRDPRSRSRFDRETRLVQGIRHPNVAHVIDSGQDGDFLYVAMEFVEGETLRRKLDHGPLAAATAFDYARQLAGALNVLHQQGISHHDLKPENLMITSGGLLKVVDFGLARQTSRRPSPSASQLSPSLGGTIQYLAPEQVKGDPPSTPADIFAYGSIFYEMLSGQRAFARATPLLSAAAIVDKQPLPLDASVPAAAAKLIARCLQKHPAKRPSATQLLIETSNLSQRPTLGTARALRAGYLVASALAVALAVIGLLAAAWNQISKQDSQLFLSGWQSYSSSPVEDVFEPAVSWDGRSLAFSGLNKSTQETDIWITPTESWAPERLVANADSPALSPDGRYLAYRSERVLYLLDRQMGQRRRIAEGAQRPRISPDGRFVAYWYGRLERGDARHSLSGSIHIMPLSGGPSLRLASNISRAGWPVWSPDSSKLLFAQKITPQECKYWVAPITGESPHPIGGPCLAGSQPLHWRETRIAGQIHAEFIVHGPNSNGTALYARTMDANSTFRLMNAPGDFVRTYTTDRDGQIYAATQRSRPEIWSLALDSPQDAHPLAARASDAILPSLDRQGSHLAFETVGAGGDAVCHSLDLLSSRAESHPGACFLSPSSKLIPATKLIWDSTPQGDQILVPQADALFGIAWEKPGHSKTQSSVSSLILRHPSLNLYLASLSPDQRWVAFTGESDSEAPRIFVAPYRGASSVPVAEWTEFAAGDYPRWTPSGDLLYLESSHPTHPRLMRQAWDARSRRPGGLPQPVRQFAAASFAVRNLPPSTFRLAASRQRVVFTAAPPQGRIFRAVEIRSNSLSQFSPKNLISSTGGFFMNTIQRTLLILGLGLGSTQAATLYNLRNDFSNTNNPNGVWSIVNGSTLLASNPAPGAQPNNFHLALSNGFFGTLGAPFAFQASVNGSVTGAGNYTNNDFLSGDIIAHSDNDSLDPELFFRWTAPQAGSILNYSGSVWYAHSPVNRSNNFFVNFNGGSNLNTGTVTSANNRGNQILFNSASAFAVNAGDILSLRLSKSNGQQFGTLSGINFIVNFEPTAAPSGIPEPSTLGLAGVTLAGALWLRRRK